jgi:hypothetical protein
LIDLFGISGGYSFHSKGVGATDKHKHHEQLKHHGDHKGGFTDQMVTHMFTSLDIDGNDRITEVGREGG